MRLSTRTRYASRALAELALVYPNGTLSIREIAARQQISAKYLEQIFAALRSSKLIKGIRGTQGGYAIGGPPESMTLLDLFEAVEGKLVLTDCVDAPDACPDPADCPTRDTWLEIRDAIVAILERTTVAELAERTSRKRAQSVLMYDI